MKSDWFLNERAFREFLNGDISAATYKDYNIIMLRTIASDIGQSPLTTQRKVDAVKCYPRENKRGES